MSGYNAFLAGGLASCIAEAVTLPFDTIKVRPPIHSSRTH